MACGSIVAWMGIQNFNLVKVLQVSAFSAGDDRDTT